MGANQEILPSRNKLSQDVRNGHSGAAKSWGGHCLTEGGEGGGREDCDLDFGHPEAAISDGRSNGGDHRGLQQIGLKRINPRRWYVYIADQTMAIPFI